MDANNVGLGERIAGISALVLLIAMFVLGWFTINGATITSEAAGAAGTVEITKDQIEASGEDASGNAWQVFSLIDIVLLIAVIAALGVVAARMSGNSLPEGAATAVLAFGALATVLLLFRLVVTPGIDDDLGGAGALGDVEVDVDVGRGIGLFIGIIASAGIAYGGMLMSGNRPGSGGTQV